MNFLAKKLCVRWILPIVMLSVTTFAYSKNPPRQYENLLVKFCLVGSFNQDTVGLCFNGVNVLSNQIVSTTSVDGETNIGGFLMEDNGKFNFYCRRDEYKFKNVDSEKIAVRLTINKTMDKEFVLDAKNGAYVVFFYKNGELSFVQYKEEPKWFD